MSNYACFCPTCKQYQYTPWGTRTCPVCKNKMVQSRVDQALFMTFSDSKKLETFIPIIPEGTEARASFNELLFEANHDAAEQEQKRLQAVIEAQRREQEKNDAIARMLISSGFSFDGYKIVKYSGYISGDDATTIPRYTGAFTASHGQNLTNALVKIRIQALSELKEAAYALGCNAVIGVDFDYIVLEPERTSLLNAQTTVKEDYVICVTANGNAVVIEKI